ncbi:MAG: magnesium-translocating P-type ATPase [Solirubrobacteraceae bacterium]|nr:magnesium-translocating P-type ATPase [Solirubrobacteraceae bacterium]
MRPAPPAPPQSTTLVASAEQPIDAVLESLGTTATGLTTAEASARLTQGGPNLIAHRTITAMDVLVVQLRNPLLWLLLGAAAISGATGDPAGACIIAAIVALSVGLGFVNEFRSARALAALHGDIHYSTVVWRDGEPVDVDVTELVRGDVVELSVGGVVPADVRLLATAALRCDEAVLTGESASSGKTSDPVPRSDSAVDLPSCAFMGTIVHQGSGRGVVVATGPATAFGAISVGLGERQTETAFQAGLREFSKMLVKVAAGLTVGILLVNLALQRPLIDAVLFSLAIAIGITPQLLPAIVSLSLSTGSRGLAKKRVLVKRLVTIEDLGNIDLLFCDKTGTLTEGAVTFDAAVDSAGQSDSRVLLLGLLCNEATPEARGGNALDRALWAAPESSALWATQDEGTQDRQLGLLPFDHDRQLVSVVVTQSGDAPLLITKGAPEALLARCIDVPEQSQTVLADLFAKGARVVAIATRPAPGLTTPAATDERDLHFRGFLTFADRPKADAGSSIRTLNGLGIQVKVITGDNGAVAAKVCRDLGMPVDRVVLGSELAALDDAALAAALPTTTVFARVTPDQKARIVRCARTLHTDVAFLGDGVNDAVALHAADVGISVESAADVAKDAADIVLLDKDLGVIADGVMEGRRIFANTMKYVLMATSSNFGNMFSAAGASLLLTFLPMLPSQILLNNLLYDVGQLAIPTDNVDDEVLARPSAWDLTFVKRFMATFGPLSSVFDFVLFFVMLEVLSAGQTEFRTGWFVESLATQTLVVFVIRTRRVPFTSSRPSRTMIVLPLTCALIGAVLPLTPLAELLGFTALPLSFFAMLVAMTVIYLALVEAAKARFYAVHDHRPPASPRSHRAGHHRHVRHRAARFHRTTVTARR